MEPASCALARTGRIARVVRSPVRAGEAKRGATAARSADATIYVRMSYGRRGDPHGFSRRKPRRMVDLTTGKRSARVPMKAIAALN
jgi:hypothetical protein